MLIDPFSFYIEDEPETGPSCYYILTGFNSTEIFKRLTPIKLKADALVKVVPGNEVTPEIPGMHIMCACIVLGAILFLK